MKKSILIDSVTIGPGTVLGLDENQRSKRAHMLESVDSDHELPEGITAHRTTKKTQFKNGEILFLKDDLPKSMAQALVGADESGKAQDSEKADAKAAKKAAKKAKAEAAKKAKADKTEAAKKAKADKTEAAKKAPAKKAPAEKKAAVKKAPAKKKTAAKKAPAAADSK